MSNKIICRKCGGDHLTIKCGKDTQNKQPIVVDNPIIIDDKKDTANIEINETEFSRYNDNPRYNRSRNYDKSKLFTVKLSDLPLDTTESELYELLQDWGHIVKVKVLSYNECNVAYIDFINNEEAIYFIEAINKTPFDSFIITAELCQNKQY